MDSQNPNESPSVETQDSKLSSDIQIEDMWLLGLCWLCVFAANMILPVWVGWSMTENYGRFGMVFAAMLLFVAGCCVCLYARKIAVSMMIGSLFVCLSQLYPILHIVIGIIAVYLVVSFGLVGPQDYDEFKFMPVHIDTALGGFVVTLLTGSSLMAVSLFIGSLRKIVKKMNASSR